MIHGDEEGLGVACEEKIEEGDRGQDRGKKQPEIEMIKGLQIEIDRDAKQAADAVVNQPDGGEEVAGLPFVGVAAAWAAIKRSEPIPQGAGFEHRQKDARFSANRAAELERASDVSRNGSSFKQAHDFLIIPTPASTTERGMPVWGVTAGIIRAADGTDHALARGFAPEGAHAFTCMAAPAFDEGM